MYDIKETIYEHTTGSDTMTITAAERWSVGMVKRLKERYPEQVEICCENPDGSLLARVPADWMQIKPKRRMPIKNINNLKSSP